MTDRAWGSWQSLVNEIGIGRSGLMAPTTYDTAWLARVPAEHDPSTSAFPEALDWLRKNQRLDGSWGAEIEYAHDRVISTLAAVLALAEQGEDGRDEWSIERGLEYIWKVADRLQHEHETIGFEMILPTLIDQCQELRFALPRPAFERYKTMREHKLARISQDMLYSGKTTLATSLEFIGDGLSLERAGFLQEDDGSVGMSPSATAYLLTQWPNNVTARHYITEIARAYGGKAPQVSPFDVSETTWSLWNLFLAGIGSHDQRFAHCLEGLKTLWDKGKGVGHSSSYSVVDADDSAVAFRVLKLAGLDPDPGPLYQFKGGTHFICYPYESNPSTSTNVHLLEALKGVNAFDIDKMLRWLRKSQVNGRYWTDKWHISPYYSTVHAIVALVDIDHDLAQSAVRWILDTQRPDGGWGYYDRPTAEETAYCLQALSVYSRQVEPVDRQVLVRGRQSLLARKDDLPALWIGKCLYAPIRVIQSAIYSALAMTES